MSETLIKVDNVSKKFCRSLKRSLWYGMQDLGSEVLGRRHDRDGELRPDEFWAVKDVSFELKRGECLGLIGHNGAGKTTLLRMLNGLIKPDAGRIEIRGRVGALISLGAGFNPILSGRENIYVNAAILGMSKCDIDKKIDEIIDFAEIGEFIDAPVQSYSSGMQVRLGFAVATTIQPDVLLLDEVLAVGDAAFRGKCFNRILGLIENCAVIFVSHTMAQIGRVSTSVAQMDKGKLALHRGNTSAGIASYNSSNRIPLDKCNVQSDMMAIESVEVIDRLKFHEITTKDNNLEEIDICITIKIKQKIEDSVVILIVLIDNDMQNVAEIWRPIADYRLIEANVFEQTVTLNKLQFNSGKYYVSCALLVGENREIAANCQYGASTVIDSGWAGYAPVRL